MKSINELSLFCDGTTVGYPKYDSRADFKQKLSSGGRTPSSYQVKLGLDMDNLRAAGHAVVDYATSDKHAAVEIDGLEPGNKYKVYITADDKQNKRLMWDSEVQSLSFSTPAAGKYLKLISRQRSE